LQYILKCNLFLVMAKLNFQHHYSSLQSRDPSEIILIGWFSTQEAFLIIINVENKLRSLIFVETMIHFSGLFDECCLRKQLTTLEWVAAASVSNTYNVSIYLVNCQPKQHFRASKQQYCAKD